MCIVDICPSSDIHWLRCSPPLLTSYLIPFSGIDAPIFCKFIYQCPMLILKTRCNAILFIGYQQLPFFAILQRPTPEEALGKNVLFGLIRNYRIIIWLLYMYTEYLVITCGLFSYPKCLDQTYGLATRGSEQNHTNVHYICFITSDIILHIVCINKNVHFLQLLVSREVIPI